MNQTQPQAGRILTGARNFIVSVREKIASRQAEAEKERFLEAERERDARVRRRNLENAERAGPRFEVFALEQQEAKLRGEHEHLSETLAQDRGRANEINLALHGEKDRIVALIEKAREELLSNTSLPDADPTQLARALTLQSLLPAREKALRDRLVPIQAEEGRRTARLAEIERELSPIQDRLEKALAEIEKSRD